MENPMYRTVLEAASAYPSWNKAADSIGMGRTKFREVIKLAKQNGANCHPSVAPTFNPPPRDYTQRPEPIITKPRMSIRADFVEPETVLRQGIDAGRYRILCVGDVHDSPKLPDKSRLKWIARHAAATKPDKIVQIGDFGDFSSCSQHETPGSIGFALKPSFRQDLESLEEALTAIYREVGSDIPLITTSGNHEFRVQRWEESHPAVEAGFYQQLRDLWARYGWKEYAYGEHVFIGGVSFIHTPMNGWGKPYGGKNPESTIANDAIFSIVYGHTHKFGVKKAPKIGPNMSVEIINVGSAMPQNYIAAYAGTSTTGWSYGIVDMVIEGGHVASHHHISMPELEERYGD